jgi:uncharacterized membrane protein YcaP (DUF421 family)
MILPVMGRVAVAFSVLLVLTRIIGKKQLSQSTFFDFATAIAIGDIAGERISDPEYPLLPWVMGTVLWFGLAILIDLIVLKNREVGKLVEGNPTVLIENGRILERNLFKNFLRVDDLMARLREKGFFNPADVEFAIFETDGTISVLPKSQVRPLQPRDLGIPTQYEGLSREVVVDRQVIRSNLREMGLDESWLYGELAKNGYYAVDDIFYAAIDTEGKLFVDTLDDRVDGSRVQVDDHGPH